MKRYDSDFYEKNRLNEWNKEHKSGGFRCAHCRQFVIINDFMGTANRNHCNLCLWSRHVDSQKGDRRSNCNGGMMPIGLTFKHEGYNRQGEIMLIHLCLSCQKISINRIARDDPEFMIIDIFRDSKSLLETTKVRLERMAIYLLSDQDTIELNRQLFGLDKVDNPY